MRPKRIGDLAIVGVVKQYGLETDGKMATYFPLQQDPNRGMFVLARSFCISPRFRHSRSNRMANHRIPLAHCASHWKTVMQTAVDPFGIRRLHFWSYFTLVAVVRLRPM